MTSQDLALPPDPTGEPKVYRTWSVINHTNVIVAVFPYHERHRAELHAQALQAAALADGRTSFYLHTVQPSKEFVYSNE